MFYSTEHGISSIDDQVTMQASRLLSSIARKRGDVKDFVEIYFNNFHDTLPIINKEVFGWKFENDTSDSHFLALLLSMFLVTQLTPQIGSPSSLAVTFGERELYPTLKSI